MWYILSEILLMFNREGIKLVKKKKEKRYMMSLIWGCKVYKIEKLRFLGNVENQLAYSFCDVRKTSCRVLFHGINELYL